MTNPIDTFVYDKLFAGTNVLPVTRAETLVSGQNLKRGTVLGKITTGGKVKIVDSTQSDGSQTPYAVLADDIDATSADKACNVYLSGEFNEDALVFGGTDTKETHRAALRDANIYMHTTQSVNG